tara:strand:- start:1032 stop:2018 length:987 start_codon:yes stop_codon:yes gene_type:complete
MKGVLLTVLFLIVLPLSGQDFQWAEVLTTWDDNDYYRDLTFGFHPSATYGLDVCVDEYLPPDWCNAVLSTEGGAYTTQIVNSTTEETAIGIITAFDALGHCSDWISISWDRVSLDSLCTSLYLRDPFGGILLDLDMLNPDTSQIGWPGFSLDISDPDYPVFTSYSYNQLWQLQMDITALGISGQFEDAEPNLNINVSTSEGVAPLAVEFNPTVSGWFCDVELAIWEFGDGETSSELNPVHVYTEVGDYTVTLTATVTGGFVFTKEQIDFIRVVEQGTGEVIYVSGDGSDESGDVSAGNPYLTIQHGLNLASIGDTVIVNPGLYFENIV